MTFEVVRYIGTSTGMRNTIETTKAISIRATIAAILGFFIHSLMNRTKSGITTTKSKIKIGPIATEVISLLLEFVKLLIFFVYVEAARQELQPIQETEAGRSMKKMHKILHIVLLVVAVLIVSIVVLIHLFGNSALKAGIETAASKTLNVGVSIYDMDFPMNEHVMNCTYFHNKYQYMIAICHTKSIIAIINHTISIQTTRSFIQCKINHETSISATRPSFKPCDQAKVN